MSSGNTLVSSVCFHLNSLTYSQDYNNGFVLPAALELATFAVGRLRSDKTCKIISALDKDNSLTEFQLTEDTLVPGDETWAKYVKGVVSKYMKEINEVDQVNGFEIAFSSDVPLGGGLSSSASLEVCTAAALEQLYGISSVSKVDRALRCVDAEHEFAHVPCGIMDQFISSCAEEGFALLIDCRSMDIERVELADNALCIVVTNSNKKHQLSGSEYPDRVRQCAQAVEAINKALKDGKQRTHLRDCSMEDLEKAHEMDPLPALVYKRALHGIGEDIRTLMAVKAASIKDFVRFGQLMNESHVSLRDNYDVSIPEIDFLVETAQAHEGVFGSRITGGGFGGCTVTLARADCAENVIGTLVQSYKMKFGVDCTSFSTRLGKGACVINEKNI